MTVLSICIPTRNRQIYAMEAVRWILKVARVDDFQVIIADNSDDPYILPKLLEDTNSLTHPQVTFIGSHLIDGMTVTLPMNLNWQRCLDRVASNWVVFIGDDDFVDPNVTVLLKRLEGQDKEIDFVYSPITVYGWPCLRTSQEAYSSVTNVSLKSGLRVQDVAMARKRMEEFRGTHGIPVGHPPYHNFIKCNLVNLVQRSLPEAKQRFFFHENTDYFMGFVLSRFVKKPIICERPFAIHGVCIKSNSYGITGLSSMQQSFEKYGQEVSSYTQPASLSSPMENYNRLRSGIQGWNSKAVYIFSLYLDYLKRFDVSFPADIGESLRSGLLHEYKTFRKEGDANAFLLGANEFLKVNFPSIAMISSNSPESVGLSGFQGYSKADESIYVSSQIGGCQSVGEFYSLINAFLVPPEFVGLPLTIKSLSDR